MYSNQPIDVDLCPLCAEVDTYRYEYQDPDVCYNCYANFKRSRRDSMEEFIACKLILKPAPKPRSKESKQKHNLYLRSKRAMEKITVQEFSLESSTYVLEMSDRIRNNTKA